MKDDNKEKKKYRHGIFCETKGKRKIKKSELLRRIELLELKLSATAFCACDPQTLCKSTDKNQL